MTSPLQSPFKETCLEHIASIALGFAKSLSGFSNPVQMELTAVQFLSQLLTQHLQASMPAPAAQPAEAVQHHEPADE